VRARTPLVVEIHEPLGDRAGRSVALGVGERLTLSGAEAFVLTGRSRGR
jgi:hypothetical protein